MSQAAMRHNICCHWAMEAAATCAREMHRRSSLDITTLSEYTHERVEWSKYKVGKRIYKQETTMECNYIEAKNEQLTISGQQSKQCPATHFGCDGV